VGLGTHDDAAVYLVRPDLAVVQSIDIFGPVVDDPYTFGQIAAANALSDLYAMGVEPRMALAFAGLPPELPLEMAGEIMRGGADKVVEAGGYLLGGHTIRDVEPKYGLAVTGFAEPESLWTNAGGRVGDCLILTKPLGSGILTTGIKRGLLDSDGTQHVIAIMSELNAAAARAGRAVGVNAATDITGFGLLGHLGELCVASGVAAEIHFNAVPIIPNTVALLNEGIAPGGSRRNLEYVTPRCHFASSMSEAEQLLLADAQTSGGLLMAVSPDKADRLVDELKREGVACFANVGALTRVQKTGPRIFVKR
jgi:selenide,water dikinase